MSLGVFGSGGLTVRDLTAAEIAERNAEIAAANAATVTERVKTYTKSIEDSPLTVPGFTEDGSTENRRHVQDTLDFVDELGANAPDTIPWNSIKHGVQEVTPAVLKAWVMAAALRRLKRFEIQTTFDASKYTDISRLETAILAEFNSE